MSTRTDDIKRGLAEAQRRLTYCLGELERYEPAGGHDYRDIQAKLIRDVRLAEADCEILTRDIVAADLARVGEGVPPAARRCPEAS